MTSPRACLGCGAETLWSFLDLGETPLANSLLAPDALQGPEPRFPLEVAFCQACALVQITDPLPPEALFSEYSYFSSVSDTVVDNAKAIATRLVSERELGPDDLAMEIASNDGYLLRNYVAAGIPVLGIEPAANVVPTAEENGVPTRNAFFTSELGSDLASAGSRASILHANNVLAHVPSINGFVKGIAAVLRDDGVAVIETPYVCDLIDHLEFDTVYHEHVFYYSLSAIDTLFRRNGLMVVDVERIPIHGGSLRVFAARGPAQPSHEVDRLLAEEADRGVTLKGYYAGFGSQVKRLCVDLRDLLVRLKGGGARLAAYGAAAKGATLLNAAGIGRELLEYVVDRSPHKQGLHMPGALLPILPAEHLAEDRPDFVLVLAWNHVEEIVRQQASYLGSGGRFIVPVPEPRILGPR